MTWYRTTTVSTVASMNTEAATAAFFDTFFTAAQAEAGFSWEIASKQLTTPAYIVLRRKGGSSGRIIFTLGSSPHAGAMAPGSTVVANSLYVGFARTSTVDVPANYTTGTPFLLPDFSGLRGFVGFSTQETRLRAYSKGIDQLLVHIVVVPVVAQSIAAIGNIFTNNDNSVNFDGLIVSGATTSFPLFGTDNTHTNTTGVTVGPDGSVFITNQWNRTVRIATHAQTGSNPSISNRLYTNDNNDVIFYPYHFTIPFDIQAVLIRRWIKLKNIAFGMSKTRDYEWLDNTFTSRGFFLGAHVTQGSDASIVSITHADM